jgi:uncharacterized repeat protein (TIGR04076 family)
MAFKVRCRLTHFLGDAEKFPCSFGHKIGDEFIYDGEKFTGRVCPYVLRGLFPHMMAMLTAGNKYCERLLWRYVDRGDAPETGLMKAGGLPSCMERGRGWYFACPDIKTQAFFIVEPHGLVEGSAFYKKEMKIVEKVKKNPGMTVNQILKSFDKKEREVTFPPLHPTLVQVMLEELVDADYIELRSGKAYPKMPPQKKALTKTAGKPKAKRT